MARINSVLDLQARDLTGVALQQTLVDLVDLALVGKQAHWTVTGPRFRTLHRQLDEIVDAARRHADAVAERAVAIGVPPDATAQTVAANTKLTDAPGGWQRDQEVVAYFVDALTRIVSGLRDRVTEVAFTDPVTQDLLLEITADLEKQSWMFQAEQD